MEACLPEDIACFLEQLQRAVQVAGSLRWLAGLDQGVADATVSMSLGAPTPLAPPPQRPLPAVGRATQSAHHPSAERQASSPSPHQHVTA
jgi:hypothetical protein